MRHTWAGGHDYSAENLSYSGVLDLLDGHDGFCAPPISQQPLDRMMAGLMDSPGHRDNILRPLHREVNIGIARNCYGIAVAQVFEGEYVRFSQTPRLEGDRLVMAGQVASDVELNDQTSVMVVWDPPLTAYTSRLPRRSAMPPGGRRHASTVPCLPDGPGSRWSGNVVRHLGMPIRTCSCRQTEPRLINLTKGSMATAGCRGFGDLASGGATSALGRSELCHPKPCPAKSCRATLKCSRSTPWWLTIRLLIGQRPLTKLSLRAHLYHHNVAAGLDSRLTHAWNFGLPLDHPGTLVMPSRRTDWEVEDQEGKSGHRRIAGLREFGAAGLDSSPLTKRTTRWAGPSPIATDTGRSSQPRAQACLLHARGAPTALVIAAAFHLEQPQNRQTSASHGSGSNPRDGVVGQGR